MIYEELAVPGVRALTPYQPGKPIEELQREYGISDIIKLASNENPLGPSPSALQAIQNELAELARYPDGNGFYLKQALAKKYHVELNQITLGNGSNDLLDVIARTFAEPADEIMFSQHAFAVYPLVAQAIGAKSVVTPARDWGHDLDAIASAVTERTKLIFLANPNNPTGTWFDKAELESFLGRVPARVIVVLDEAYFEYASNFEPEHYPDGLDYLKSYANLIVTRTFSKAYGLAGLRVGYVVSHPDIANLLNRVRQPFNVNSIALTAAAAALDDHTHLDSSLRLNQSGMQQYQQAFRQHGLEYIASLGNFISVNVGENAMGVYDALLREGVIVRPVENYAMPGYLRFSIGTEAENARAISALEKIIK
ncbi:MAG: histidinol-phosphate transaminase [Gammaproteobacteria bacterium]|nr:histidinol-phosphate transaminase [Gammaproteobacteria bacterium]